MATSETIPAEAPEVDPLLERLRAQDVPGATERVQAVLLRARSAFDEETAAR